MVVEPRSSKPSPTFVFLSFVLTLPELAESPAPAGPMRQCIPSMLSRMQAAEFQNMSGTMEPNTLTKS